jgi:hypothetical protein
VSRAAGFVQRQRQLRTKEAELELIICSLFKIKAGRLTAGSPRGCRKEKAQQREEKC